MILTTVKIEDFDRWWNTFSTKGAEKRKQHGSKGSYTFRDPNDESRTWTVFPTGTRRAFRTSCPIPTFRRSFKKRESKVGPNLRNSPASTTHSQSRRGFAAVRQQVGCPGVL